GPWPPRLEAPQMKRLESIEREEYVQHHVQVPIAPGGRTADGYLLIPVGGGPFPAVLVPFYEPETSIGEGAKGRGTHDYGLQLVRRGFVTLSIGTPLFAEKARTDTRRQLPATGSEWKRQPPKLLRYAAANC